VAANHNKQKFPQKPPIIGDEAARAIIDLMIDQRLAAGIATITQHQGERARDTSSARQIHTLFFPFTVLPSRPSSRSCLRLGIGSSTLAACLHPLEHCYSRRASLPIFSYETPQTTFSTTANFLKAGCTLRRAVWSKLASICTTFHAHALISHIPGSHFLAAQLAHLHPL